VTAKNRISKVTTRAGDRGTTKLATGRTVAKHDDVVRAIGSVDELNSHIGMLVSALTADNGAASHLAALAGIQQALFDIGAVFAMEGAYAAPGHEQLEETTAALNDQLPPLTEFVIPGGGHCAAQSHICRAVCRRAETDVWKLYSAADEPQENLLAVAQYLNRLSDYFFVLARTVTGTAETQWQGPGGN